MDRAPPDVSEGGDGPVLVYDGDCPFCVAASEWLLRRAPAGARRRPAQEFAGQGARDLEAAGVRSALLVAPAGGGPPRAGLEGVALLLEGGRTAWWVRLLLAPALRPVLTPLYRLVAQNRRVLFPPASCGSHACDPPPRPLLEVALVATSLLLALLVVAPLGALLWPRIGLGAAGAGALSLALAWSLLLLGQCAAGLLAPRSSRWRAARHGALVVALGALPNALVLPLAPFLSGTPLVLAFTLTFSAGTWLLLRLQVSRRERLGLGPRDLAAQWVALWLALILALVLRPGA
jgi:predicted DCC family thiol-disulfide oxidoreductase YuxK